MKKIFSIFLILALAISVLSGCGNKDVDSNKKNTTNSENKDTLKDFSWQKSNVIKLFCRSAIADDSVRMEVEATYNISPFIKYDNMLTLSKAWEDVSKMDSKFSPVDLEATLEYFVDVSKQNNSENLVSDMNGGFWHNSGGYAYAFIFAEYKNVSEHTKFTEQFPYDSNDGFYGVEFREGDYEIEKLDVGTNKTLEEAALCFEVFSDGNIKKRNLNSIKLTEDYTTKLYVAVIPEWVSKEHPFGNKNTEDLGARFHSDTGYEQDQCIPFGKTY